MQLLLLQPQQPQQQQGRQRDMQALCMTMYCVYALHSVLSNICCNTCPVFRRELAPDITMTCMPVHVHHIYSCIVCVFACVTNALKHVCARWIDPHLTMLLWKVAFVLLKSQTFQSKIVRLHFIASTDKLQLPFSERTIKLYFLN